METDPVCNMRVDPNSVTEKSDYQGKTYYFCSSECKNEFDKNPDAYAHGQQSGPSMSR